MGGFFRRRYLTAVEDVSFRMPEEKPCITTLAGESGSGKSTISRAILGLLSPSSGKIRYRGKDLQELLRRDEKAYRKEVQSVFQDPFSCYNPFYNVDRVLMMPINKFKLASSTSEKYALIEESLETAGLSSESILGRYPYQLSGGEAQRLMVAKALLPRPKLLVADEPVTMIDVSLRAGILNLLLDLKKKFDMSILFVTHDFSVANYLSDNIIILNLGRIVEMGIPREVIKNPIHPYTKHLMSSVPIPNPQHRWKDKIDLSGLTEHLGKRYGCLYYERCRHGSDRCVKEKPQLIEATKDHWIACHLTL